MPAVLNAANEVAVQAFLEGSINFLAIPNVIETTMARHVAIPLDDISVASGGGSLGARIRCNGGESLPGVSSGMSCDRCPDTGMHVP